MTPTTQRIERTSYVRWVSYATCAWSVAFGAPHLWWALGVPWGFPGGHANYEMFMASGWRFAYDVFVIACSALGVIVSLVLLNPRPTGWRWIPHMLAWIAAALLTVRGVAGLIVDRGRDLVWDPTFLVGGILFLSVAWSARTPRSSTPAA